MHVLTHKQNVTYLPNILKLSKKKYMILHASKNVYQYLRESFSGYFGAEKYSYTEEQIKFQKE